MPPQLLLLAAVGVGLYAGVRWLKRSAEAIAEDLQRQHAEARERTRATDAKDLGVLEFDPKSGTYRPQVRD